MDGIRILLIRHGESEWNAVRRWQGIADVELTERGREQGRRAAQVLVRRFDDPTRVTIWSSTLRRAAETADLIAAAFGVDDTHPDARLVEADAGPWQGLTPVEIDAGWPGDRANGRRPAGFEGREAVLDRAHRAIVDIGRATQPGQQPIVVTHSGVIRTIVGEAGITDLSIPNLAGWYVDVAGDEIIVIEPFDPGNIDVDRRSASTSLG
jgi:broad specificity phosphatase PhoE